MKNYKILSQIYTLLIMLAILFPQQYGGYGKNISCEITGYIYNSKTEAPIEHATITVFNSENVVETGGITDADGLFDIDDVNPGKYNVVIEFIGFSKQEFNDIKLNPRNKVKDFGKIYLEPSSLLIEGVQVIDKKPIFEFETDKMIYNSSDDIVAGSGTAEDVLNKVPMVTVDSDGEVSLRGNPNVKILINGRPNRQGGDVDNIPASIIEKVEVITSPSAKYDPEGMAGIINIVLEKGRFEGFNGSIKVNAKHNKFNSVDKMNGFTFYSNYKTDKYNLYGSYSLNNRVRQQEGFRKSYSVIDGDMIYTYSSHDYDFESMGDRFGQSLTLGSDYSLTEKININSEISLKNNYGDKLNSQKYRQDGEISYDVLKIEGGEEGENSGNGHGELFFEIVKNYDDPDKELLFSTTLNVGKDSEWESNLITNDTTFVDESKKETEVDFNYKFPINENSKIEFGYDGRFNFSEESMKFALTAEDESWEFSGRNEFDFSRQIHGVFVEYENKINEKFSIKPSLRIEKVNKKINFFKYDFSSNTDELSSVYSALLENTPDSSYAINEVNYYPDLHFTYNLNSKQSIQFGVSRRIERPGGRGHGKGFGQMRPFPRNVYNDSFIMIGNPFLKPELSTQYEISFKSPMPMGFFYTNFYRANIKNSIRWYMYNGTEYDDYSGSVVTFRNAEKVVNYGIEAFMMIVGQTLGGSYNYNNISDSSNDFELNGVNERFNMYMRVNFPEEYIKIFSFEFGFYYMKMKVPGGTLFGSKGTMWANTGISKSLFDDRLNVSLSIDNILDAGGFQMKAGKPITGGEEITEVYASRGGRTFSMSLKYNFGKMQEEKRRGRGYSRGGGQDMDMGY